MARASSPRVEPLVRPSEGANRYAPCRAMGHEWKHRGVDPNRYGNGVRFGAVALVSVCGDCKTVRTKWINRRGETVGLDYDRDACPNYSEHGDDKRSPQQWRLAFATNLWEALPAMPQVANAS